MTLHFERSGAGDTTIVLLHGFASSHRVWDAVRSGLAQDATVYAYDLPGHGGSFAYPQAGPAKVAATALLADLGLRASGRVHLVGHSMGGAIAALMAMFEPGRIASLTLLAPGGFGPEINHRLLSRHAAGRSEGEVAATLEAMFGWYSPVPRQTVADTLAARAGPEQAETLVEIAKRLTRDGRQGQLPRDKLDGFAMPVTVAWGELDNVLPARHAQGLPAHFRVHLYPDLGHMLPEEAPDEMERLIRATAGLPDHAAG